MCGAYERVCACVRAGVQGFGNYDPSVDRSMTERFMEAIRPAGAGSAPSRAGGPPVPASTGVPEYSFASNRGGAAAYANPGACARGARGARR